MLNAKEVATSWISKQANGDIEGSFAKLHENLTWTITGTTPISGRHSKQHMITEIFQKLAPVMSGEFIVDEVIGDGDRAIVLARAIGKGPTGPYNQHYCLVLRIADDKVIEIVEYCDTALIETALCGRKLVDAA
jgi:ketosteroid isomerase-like protein